MKLKGLLGYSEVVMFIDSGATHSFVSLEKVVELKLPITDSGSFGISSANGEMVKGNGGCAGIY